MAEKAKFESLQRVFPHKKLLRGKPRRAILWSICGSCLICLQLFNLLLISDLLSNGGTVRLQDGQYDELLQLLPGSLPEHGTDTVSYDSLLQDRGILSTVWWSRHTILGWPLAELYQRTYVLRSNRSAFPTLIAAVVLLGFLRGLMVSHVRSLANTAAMDVTANLRHNIHRQTLRLGPSDVQDTRSDHVFDLFTVQVDRIRDGISQTVRTLVSAPIELAMLLLFAMSLEWRVTLQCLVPLGFCWYLVNRQHKRAAVRQSLMTAHADRELRLLAESLRKTRLVRGYGMETLEQKQFEVYAQRFRNNITALVGDVSWSQRGTQLMCIGCLGIVVYLLGVHAMVADADRSLPAAAVIVIMTAFACMFRPLKNLTALPEAQANASQASAHVHRYLNLIPEVGQAVGAKFLQPLSHTLQFESLQYTLPDQRPLLNDCSLRITAGEVVALVALDPLEPRALAYMLPRFIEPQSGRVLFDGEDIAWVTLESLRAETIYVGGSDPFFSGTVMENISCGNSDFAPQQVIEAAKQVHAHNFILKLKQGYETALGEHGDDLGPGEAFRLGLARAILRNPALMIIEEPQALLDDDTKSLLDDAYNRICVGRTVLFLPSRLSTLKRADNVILLQDGRPHAVGPHSKLVKSSPLYRHWEYLNFNEFRSNGDDSE